MAVAYESDGGTVWAAANNNNAVSVPLPATRPVGSVLLFVAWCRLISAAAPAPTGYTLLHTSTSGTASGGRLWIYAKEVVGGESNPSVTPAGTTGTSGDVWGACIYCYSGVDLSGGISAILDGTPTTQDASGTTTCTYPALTIASANSYVVRTLCRFRDAADTFTFTSTWAEREDASTTNRTGGQHHLQDKQATSSGSQATVTVAPSNTTAARYLGVTLALKQGLIPVTGAATITGTGDLSATGTRLTFASATVAAAGALTATGVATVFGQATLTGTGSLAATGVRETFAEGGAGAVTDDFNRADGWINDANPNWTADVVNNGADPPEIVSNQLQAVNVPPLRSAWWNASLVDADCEVSITLIDYVGTNNLHGVTLYLRITDPGTSNVDAYQADFVADSTSGTHDLIVLSRWNNGSQTFLVYPAVTKYQNGDELKFEAVGDVLTASRKRGGSWSVIATTTDSSGSKLSGDGYVGLMVQTDLSIYDNFYASPAVSAGAAIELTGTGSLTADGDVGAPEVVTGAANLTGAGALAASGVRETFAAIELAGAGTLSAAAVVTREAVAVLTGTGALAVAGEVERLSSATLTGSGALAATGQHVGVGQAALSGTGSLTAVGVRRVFGAATLTGTGTSAATGVRKVVGGATLAGTSTLIAAGIRTTMGAATVSGTGTLTADWTVGPVTVVGAATLTGQGTIAATGIRKRTGTATLAGTGTLQATGRLTVRASAALLGSGQIAVLGVTTRPGTAVLTGTGTLTATGALRVSGQATLTGEGELLAAWMQPMGPPVPAGSLGQTHVGHLGGVGEGSIESGSTGALVRV